MGCVGLGLLVASLAACGSQKPPATPGSSGSPAPTSAPTSAPSASPGDLPVDALGAGDVSWDQVGPGWFMVSWRDEPLPDAASSDNTPSIHADTVYLVDLDGRFYRVASLKGLDVSSVEGWIGTSALLFREQTYEPDGGWMGDTIVDDLAAGETRTALADHVELEGYVLDDGRVISNEFYGADWSIHTLFDDYVPVADLCGSEPIKGLELSPSQTYLVCLKGNWAGVVDPDVDSPTTDVIVSSLAPPYSAEVIASFKLPPQDYQLNGWLDDNTFLVSRQDESGNWVYFAYDVASRDIADFVVPVPGASQDPVFFEDASRTYDFLSKPGIFYSETGEKLVSVGCPAGSVAGQSIESGARALVICSSVEQQDGSGAWSGTESLWIVDLENGTATKLVETGADTGYDSLHFISGVYGYNSVGRAPL